MGRNAGGFFEKPIKTSGKLFYKKIWVKNENIQHCYLLFSNNIIFNRISEKLYKDTTALVAGWGAINETGKWSCTVLEAELPVLSNEACRNTKYNASKITEVMMCAGFPETAHKDACTVSTVCCLYL